MLMALSSSTIATILDVAIVLILIIYAVSGVVKGFYSSLLKLISSIGALAAAIFGAKPLLGLINGIVNISNIFSNLVFNTLSKNNNVFTQVITDEDVRAQVIDSIRESEIFSILKNFMIDLVQNAEIGSTVGHVISAPIGYIISVIVVAIVIFLLVKFVVFLLSKLFANKEIERGGKSGLDRTLGLVFGTAKGLVIIVGIYILVSLASFIPLGSDMITPNINETHIVKPTYNIVNEKVSDFVNNQDWNEIIKKAFN